MRRKIGALTFILFFAGFTVLAQGILPSAYPDLVILQVTYETSLHSGGWVNHTFSILVKNIGGVDATISTKAAILLAPNIYDVCKLEFGTTSSAAYLFGDPATVPPLAAGASTTVKITATLAKAELGPCLVIVLADAPVPGKPLGQLSEHGIIVSFTGAYPGEMNNAFMFPLGVGIKLPATFKNPAF